MFKKNLFTLLFWSIALTALQATHIVGGEIRYTCQGFDGTYGTYAIDMRIYRDCHNGQPFFDNPASVGIFSSDNPGTPLQVLSINYTSVDSVSLSDNDPCHLPPNGLCVDVADYHAEGIVLPYNPAGYYFVYQRCCRNEIINNITVPGETGATYYVFMSGAAQLVCNSSPAWSDYPPVMICLGQPLAFDHSATDAEGDQLSYSFCAPLQGGTLVAPLPTPPSGPPFMAVEYIAGYTATEPMGGNPLVAIDPATGLIAGVPNQLGDFAIGVCGQEFRNGVLMSEFRRDVQFIVSSCNQSVLVASLHPDTPCDETLSSIDLEVANGTPPYSYLWSDGATTPDLPAVTPGQSYTVSIADAAGCTTEITIQGNDCVWPGDADYDGVANNFDILAIGLFYGDNGPVRVPATTDWSAHPAAYWNDYQISGVNTKHIDCNGTGSIDVFDLLPVDQNYGLSHPTAFHPAFDPNAAELTITLNQTSFLPNNMLVATLNLGSANVPAEDVYGIAFSVHCDPVTAMHPDWGWFVDFGGSIFGDENHTISYTRSYTPGFEDVDAVICNTRRLAFPELSGPVGTFGFLMADTAPATPVTLTLSDIRLINAQGEIRPVNASGAVLGLVDASEPIGAGKLILHPNPARDQVTLQVGSAETGPVLIELLDAEGRKILVRHEELVGNGNITLLLPSLTPGIYWIRLQTPKQVYWEKMMAR